MTTDAIADSLNHLQSLLSQIFACIYEEQAYSGISYNLVYTAKEILESAAGLFSTIQAKLGSFEFYEMDALMAPALRILSVINPRKRNEFEDYKYREMLSIFPALREAALGYTASILKRTGPCNWKNQSLLLEKLLLVAKEGVFLGEFFIKSGLTVDKSFNALLCQQTLDQAKGFSESLQFTRMLEPTLGKKRKSKPIAPAFDNEKLLLVSGVLPRLTCSDAFLLELFAIYQSLFALKVEGRFVLLNALYETMVIKYVAEFHPLLGLLIRWVQAEQPVHSYLVEHLASNLLLLIQPRRRPFPIAESTPERQKLESEETIGVIAPFPDTPINTFPSLEHFSMQPVAATSLHAKPLIDIRPQTLPTEEQQSFFDLAVKEVMDRRQEVELYPPPPTISVAIGYDDELPPLTLETE